MKLIKLPERDGRTLMVNPWAIMAIEEWDNPPKVYLMLFGQQSIQLDCEAEPARKAWIAGLGENAQDVLSVARPKVKVKEKIK